MQYLPRALIVLLTAIGCSLSAQTEIPPATSISGAVQLAFPTENKRLLTDDYARFYQTTITKRPISGMFGFVRTNGPEPARYFERFHEGLDIQPVRRDSGGTPLDPVMAAAGGIVVYVNRAPGKSGYGNYVMLRHRFGSYDAYTTYGHLASASVEPGQAVKSGDTLGILGHTGPDIPQERSHLHFEIGFMLHPDYKGWYAREDDPDDGPNYHGNYNGINFMGVDPAPILKASSAGDPPTVPELFQRERHQFTVQIPARGYCDMQKRFDFLTPHPPPDLQKLHSWKIECNRIGLPLRFIPSEETVPEPKVLWFKPGLSLQESFTRGLLQKKNGEWILSKHGKKWASLIGYGADKPFPL